MITPPTVVRSVSSPTPWSSPLLSPSACAPSRKASYDILSDSPLSRETLAWQSQLETTASGPKSTPTPLSNAFLASPLPSRPQSIKPVAVVPPMPEPQTPTKAAEAPYFPTEAEALSPALWRELSTASSMPRLVHAAETASLLAVRDTLPLKGRVAQMARALLGVIVGFVLRQTKSLMNKVHSLAAARTVPPSSVTSSDAKSEAKTLVGKRLARKVRQPQAEKQADDAPQLPTLRLRGINEDEAFQCPWND